MRVNEHVEMGLEARVLRELLDRLNGGRHLRRPPHAHEREPFIGGDMV
jgi:hypothetical protein